MSQTSETVEPLNDHVRKFIAINARCPVSEGQAIPTGGAIYTLANGTMFKFTLAELRSMPAPKWPWDFPGYENAREQGEFRDGATVRRAPEHG